MLVSFVIRVAAAALSAGRLVGDVEHVPTGARGTFRDAQELIAWCHAVITAPDDVIAVPPPRVVDSDATAPAAPASPGELS